MSLPSRERHPREAVLGQLPRMERADGSPIRVLLVDDEPALTNLVKMALHYEGWIVEVAHNGQAAVEKFNEIEPDIVVLDIMLPDTDGLQLLQQVREADGYTPTLFLTARDSVMDRVSGLTAGADDYMTKPFSLEELVARLRGLLRRSSHLAPQADEVLRVGDMVMHSASREVTRAGEPIRPDGHRIRVAAVSDAQSAPGHQSGRDPRPRLELRVRRQVEHRRSVHLVSAQEDRCRARADDQHRARCGLYASTGRMIDLAE